MSAETSETVITVDMSKQRIRIYKSALHLLGDPKYVQLLVNPGKSIVAFRGVDRAEAADMAHKVIVASDTSMEIYSSVLCEKLREVAPVLSQGYSYRLSGTVIPGKRLAVFSLKTPGRIEKTESVAKSE